MKRCQACDRQFKDDVRFCPFDGQALAAIQASHQSNGAPLIGRVVGGKYRLEAKLREDQMVAVYGATQLALERPVIVKLVHLNSDAHEFVDQLRSQARQLATLRHANVVEVIEIGVSEQPSAVYAATEFVDGISLKKRLEKLGPLNDQEAVTSLRQISTALEAIRCAGMTGRGVTSESIWLDYSNGPVPQVKLDCLWLAPTTSETSGLTENGQLLPRVAYFSPEECEGKAPDARSDVYRLGLLAYEMFAGHPPFESDSLAELITMHREEAPTPLDLRQPARVPPNYVEKAMMRALAKLSQYRQQTPADFGRELESMEQTSRATTILQDISFENADEALPVLSHLLSRPTSVLDNAGVAPTNETVGEARPGHDNSSAEVRSGEGDLNNLIQELKRRSIEFDRSAVAVTPASDPQADAAKPPPPVAVVPGNALAEDVPQPEFVFADVEDLPATSPEPEPIVIESPDLVEASLAPAKPIYLDENVQFTVYRPKVVRPVVWSTLLAFAHLSERSPDEPESAPDPIEEVRRQAELVLGKEVDQFQTVVHAASQPMPREGELSFVPTVPGIEFNPPRRTFRWVERVHREEFRFRASAKLDRQVARGRMSVFLGGVLIGETALNIRVDSSNAEATVANERDTANVYRKVFASYSHRDAAIVERFERFAEAVGDRYLRDVRDLRAGEVWSAKLEKLILESDVFQLFWSSNSMVSPFVRQEWEYALSLRRPNFIRPTYWEDPLPNSPQQNLPPEELTRLHFQKIGDLAEVDASATVSRSSNTGGLASGPAVVSSKPTMPANERTDPAAGFEFNETPARQTQPAPPAAAPPQPSVQPAYSYPPAGGAAHGQPNHVPGPNWQQPGVPQATPPARISNTPVVGARPPAFPSQPAIPASIGAAPAAKSPNMALVIGILAVGVLMILGLFAFLFFRR